MSDLNSQALALDRQQRELLKLVATGSKENFALFCHDVHESLIRFVFLYTHSQHRVQEIVEDSLQTVWSSAADYTDDARVIVWLLAIANRKSRLAIAKRDTQNANGHHCDELHAAPNLLERSDLQPFDTLTEQLDTKHRVTIELAYYHGFSCAEISTVLDCSEWTARTALHYSQKKLHEWLNNAGAASADGLKSTGLQ